MVCVPLAEVTRSPTAAKPDGKRTIDLICANGSSATRRRQVRRFQAEASSTGGVTVGAVADGPGPGGSDGDRDAGAVWLAVADGEVAPGVAEPAVIEGN